MIDLSFPWQAEAMQTEPALYGDSEPERATDVELLSFRLGGEEFSVSIMSVREIRGWTPPTPLPHAEAYMRGVINLRGTILPVIDLAQRLGMPPLAGEQRNVIIVVQSGGHLTGLLVEAVSDIVVLPRSALHPPPAPGTHQAESSIASLAVRDGQMLRILDLAMLVPDGAARAA
jgi:purine-binding chemotaxis protein CheW